MTLDPGRKCSSQLSITKQRYREGKELPFQLHISLNYTYVGGNIMSFNWFGMLLARPVLSMGVAKF